MDIKKTQEETLREAACLGDLEGIQELLTQGVNPNSQNVMNGWTALHWSAKRGHRDIAQALLDCGADPHILNSKGESAASLTTDASLAQLLGETKISDNAIANKLGDGPTFVPHYLAHPPLNVRVEKAIKASTTTELQPYIPPTLMSKLPKKCGSGCTRTEVGCQDELVLKVRVAGSADPDFIEVEVGEASFSSLLRVCCEELGVAAQRVTRVRKLPNTVVRKDADVQRLQYLQELELVVEETSLGGAFAANEELPLTAALSKSNSYQSISKNKNQTILY